MELKWWFSLSNNQTLTILSNVSCWH